jgi:hypothetical protein
VQQRGSQPDIGLIPVHIATHAPERWAEIEAAKADAGGNANVWLSKQVQTAILTQRLDWGQLGIDPRWLETETSDCAAAIDASIYANHGADELDRFLAGAAGRGDVAVLVMTMGDVNDDMPRSVLAQYDASVNLRSHTTSIAGRRLPQGAATRLADDVDGPDRDLGVRLRQRVAEHPWWSLHLTGRTYIGNLGEEHNEPEGGSCPYSSGRSTSPSSRTGRRPTGHNAGTSSPTASTGRSCSTGWSASSSPSSHHARCGRSGRRSSPTPSS